MTDVSIYVALITGATGAIGAGIPQIATVWRDTHQAKLDRQERGENARQQACVELLAAAAGLRTRVENTAMYHGSEMPVRLAEIRGGAADVQVKAAKVAFLAAGLAAPAQGLGEAAAGLAVSAVASTDMATNVMTMPDPGAFDEAVARFSAQALGRDTSTPADAGS